MKTPSQYLFLPCKKTKTRKRYFQPTQIKKSQATPFRNLTSPLPSPPYITGVTDERAQWHDMIGILQPNETGRAAPRLFHRSRKDGGWRERREGPRLLGTLSLSRTGFDVHSQPLPSLYHERCQFCSPVGCERIMEVWLVHPRHFLLKWECGV